MSPVLIAWATPWSAQTVGRWRRSRSPSSMSSWTRLKLWPSSTAAAPGQGRLGSRRRSRRRRGGRGAAASACRPARPSRRGRGGSGSSRRRPRSTGSWSPTRRRISSSVSAIRAAASRTGWAVVIAGHGSGIRANMHPRSSLLRATAGCRPLNRRGRCRPPVVASIRSSHSALRRFSGVAHQRSPFGSSPQGPFDGVPAWTNRSGRRRSR